MSSPQQPRRGARVRKQTAKGQAYSLSLAQNALPQAQAPTVTNASANNTINGSSSGQGNADGGLRRSKRTRRTPSTTVIPNKKRRVSQPGSTVEGFMIKLYAEIHRAATVKTVGQWERYWTRHLLRQARTLRFFDLVTKSTRRTLITRLDKFESNDPKEKRIADLAKDDVGIDHAQRLTEFCDAPNLLLLTICAHSKSFREAIIRSDVESRAQGVPEWGQIYPKIKECASSLELFARTYKFDWTDALVNFDADFEVLLITVYKDCPDTRGKSGANFGIGDDDLRETHQIGDEDKHRIHHHWVLPVEDGEPAAWPSVECTITQDLTKAGYVHGENAIAGIPEQGNHLEVNRAAMFPLKEKRWLQQFNIDQSIVLADYDWQALAPKMVSFDGSDYADPAFCGFPNNPCKVCGAVELAPFSSSATVVTGAGKKQYNQAGLACQCRFADLCKKYNKPPQNNHRDILVELYTTADRGRGVRALQTIRPGTYLGEYLGEITAVEADAEDVPGSMVNHRYGLQTYHMQLDVARAADYVVSVRTTTTTRPKPKGSPATGKAKSTTSTTPTADAELRPQYALDAAHRGGWTRYVNHSCAANTEYRLVNLGQHTHVVVRARRKIAFGEEITVNYGGGYFANLGIACRCGAARCKYKNVVAHTQGPTPSGDESKSESKIESELSAEASASASVDGAGDGGGADEAEDE
ncbi:hypothetical protein AYL99_08870 [Fonsecaea erecta]|uniref:SET domain-containing protein n=1 Tax=Fonsecaea erecta TaxID=1367422 RepID=A0A178ZAF6_9EURO|nr:hypothetical protein AYL99_08870 [Fonsecaea erecta]OAP56758.1 hypothetical protein AYL99_08870 [Fonsecaea erecta]